MGNLINLHSIKNEARVDTRILARKLQNKHGSLIQLIDTHKKRFEKLGIIPFKMAKSKRGKPTRYALLNEDQAYLLLAFSKNTDHIADLKVDLVQAFFRFRKHEQSEADYLPFYHELHDEVKVLSDMAHESGSSTCEQIFHINFNKLINKAFNLKSGQRSDLPDHLRAKVTAANVIAGELLKEAINNGMDHKQAYAYVKQGVIAFSNCSMKLQGVASNGSLTL